MGRSAIPLLFLFACGACSKTAAKREDAGPTLAQQITGRAPIASWEEAKGLEPEELSRLATKEGPAGLREMAEDRPEYRVIALSAMGHTGSFSEFPWLLDVAEKGNESEAVAALESAIDLASNRRVASDPEDAEEIAVGCAKLADLVTKGSGKQRRVLAARAAKLMADRECAKSLGALAIPAELSAH